MTSQSPLRFLSLLSCCLLAFGSFSVKADVKPNALFSNGMILQREAVVPIWGSATPGEQVTVEFSGQRKTATADSTGKWMVKLDPMKVNASAQDLTITGTGTPAKITNVLVGDVYLASGQSNMDFPVSSACNAVDELPKADDPLLRFFQLKKQTSDTPQSTVSGGSWVAATPDTAKGFSGVAYFFAREIRNNQGCPVGIIQGAWGGTPIRIWISHESLGKAPALTNDLADWDKAVADHAKVVSDPKVESDYQAALAAWKHDIAPAYDAAMKQYNADKAAGKDPGQKPKPSQPEPQNPDPMAIPSPSKRPHTPSVAYNAMIHPLAPLAIRGALWYQGEENGSQGVQYREWLPRLIGDWRTTWGQDFPFLIVQLPCNGKDPKPVAENGWPWVREAQFRALALPKTSLAVTVDVGDPSNVHPADKIDVGKRLSLLARRDVYGEKIDASGPLYQSFKVDGDKIRVTFKETAKGLKPGQAPWCAKGVEPLPTDKLVGFVIAGADKNWVEADAVIEGNDVIVSSKTVTSPVAVRYGWANSPRCNLYNSEGLPSSPFRTDDWEK